MECSKKSWIMCLPMAMAELSGKTWLLFLATGSSHGNSQELARIPVSTYPRRSLVCRVLIDETKHSVLCYVSSCQGTTYRPVPNLLIRADAHDCPGHGCRIFHQLVAAPCSLLTKSSKSLVMSWTCFARAAAQLSQREETCWRQGGVGRGISSDHLLCKDARTLTVR